MQAIICEIIHKLLKLLVEERFLRYEKRKMETLQEKQRRKTKNFD